MPLILKRITVNRRIVLHVDMDSFFASVEVRERPELKGLPVVVGSDPKRGRGVVSTCSYEAGNMESIRQCRYLRLISSVQIAAFLPVNMQLYKQVSTNVMAILRGFADKFEQVSVDEAYLLHLIYTFEDAILYARTE